MGLFHSAPQPQPDHQSYDKPWRPVNWRVRDQMLRTLTEFQSAQGVDNLRILVVGPIGSGKSSFINSFNNTAKGRNTYLAHSLTGGSSATTTYKTYKLSKGTDGSFFPFVFGDTMGLEEGPCGIYTDDLINTLGGHVLEGYNFRSSVALTPESNDYNRNPTLSDKVHCLVFVLPADKIYQTSEEMCFKLKRLLQNARELGIPQAVILSKVDKKCPLVSDDLKMIYRSKKIKMVMEACSSNLGIPMNYIFPVKNYHEEITINAETDILILMAVTNIVGFASDHVKTNV